MCLLLSHPEKKKPYRWSWWYSFLNYRTETPNCMLLSMYLKFCLRSHQKWNGNQKFFAGDFFEFPWQQLFGASRAGAWELAKGERKQKCVCTWGFSWGCALVCNLDCPHLGSFQDWRWNISQLKQLKVYVDTVQVVAGCTNGVSVGFSV